VTLPAEPILDACRDAGFALSGVCPAEPSHYADHYREWLTAGKHGSMTYLARHVEERLDPRTFLPGARSIILVADQYDVRPRIENRAPDGARIRGAGVSPGGERRRGRIARYARGRDYHTVMKKRLHAICDTLRAEHPADQFRAFVDTAPVLEREHAARAGLGWIGKHTLLIHPQLGSWLFLGGFLTTLDIAPPADAAPITDHCGTCTRCIDACPTSAITPYSVDATRCIAYLTIEHRDPIDGALAGEIGEWVFGCDVCQEVCPHNSPRPSGSGTGEANPAYAPRRDGFDLLEILGWTEADRRGAFAKSALKRATLAMMKRNAILALRSHPPGLRDEQVRAALTHMRDDDTEPDLVRDAARLALARANA